MREFLSLLLCALFLSASAAAQPIPVIDAQPTLSRSAQRVAEVTSNVTLGAALGRQIWDAWHVEDRRRAFVMTGVRMSVTAGSTWGLKRLMHRRRPCAPFCGAEHSDTSWPSGHTALACTSTGAALQWTVPLSAGVGLGRVFARKHWTSDVLSGCLIGWAAGRWIR